MLRWKWGDETVRPLKPDYDAEAVQWNLIKQVCSYFGRVFDDKEQEKHRMLRGHRPEDDAWKRIMCGKPTVNQTEFPSDSGEIPYHTAESEKAADHWRLLRYISFQNHQGEERTGNVCRGNR